LLFLVLSFLSIVSARGAVRVIMMLAPIVAISASYISVQTAKIALSKKDAARFFLGLIAVAIIAQLSSQELHSIGQLQHLLQAKYLQFTHSNGSTRCLG
jgi:asparagine N-glycosylation enzyme membrane subunit Stt3